MKVFNIDDGEYYAGRNQDEAVAAYREDTGQEPTEVIELTDEELDRLKVNLDEDEDEAPTGEITTFREYLLEETGGVDVDAFMLCSANA